VSPLERHNCSNLNTAQVGKRPRTNTAVNFTIYRAILLGDCMYQGTYAPNTVSQQCQDKNLTHWHINTHTHIHRHTQPTWNNPVEISVLNFLHWKIETGKKIYIASLIPRDFRKDLGMRLYQSSLAKPYCNHTTSKLMAMALLQIAQLCSFNSSCLSI